jgi:catechol 2,3-dioxygenase-like lactoylglutathione lyase family enzyme
VIEIISSDKIESFSRPERCAGINHWGMNVRDKDAAIRGFEKKGIPIIKFDARGKWIYFIKDPDGNLIEIYQE